MDRDPRIGSYDWAGGREALLRFGPDDASVVVIALPLLEEHNRTRAFAVSMLRALAARGVAGVLPDLPAQGESLTPTRSMTITDLRTAFAAASPPGARAIAIRSGALLDASATLRWHFAPQTGPELARELHRLKAIGGRGEFAGNLLSTRLLSELEQDGADLPNRTVRLSGDTRPADRHVIGMRLWRRAEPDNDPALAVVLADDIASWMTTCAA